MIGMIERTKEFPDTLIDRVKGRKRKRGRKRRDWVEG